MVLQNSSDTSNTPLSPARSVNMKKCGLQGAFVHKIYFVSYNIGNSINYQFCRQTSNCPFPSAQGSSGRKQLEGAPVALCQLYIPLIAEVFRCPFPQSRSYLPFSTPHAGLCQNHMIMVESWQANYVQANHVLKTWVYIHCTEIGCK